MKRQGEFKTEINFVTSECSHSTHLQPLLRVRM